MMPVCHMHWALPVGRTAFSVLLLLLHPANVSFVFCDETPGLTSVLELRVCLDLLCGMAPSMVT